MSNEIQRAIIIVSWIAIIWLLRPRRHSSELPSKEYREKHQAEYQDVQDELREAQYEIVDQDRRIAKLINTLETCLLECQKLTVERDEANQSAEHWQERFKTSEEIRQKLAASLSGRCCGHRITMGNTEAKIVHGSVVVIDPDGFPKEFGKIRQNPDGSTIHGR